MTASTDDHAARALGAALTALRGRCGLSQEQAGARLGLTGQAWGKYETGRSPGIFRPATQTRLTRAVESTPEALMAIVAAASGGPGVHEPSAAWMEGDAEVRRLTLSDDEMAPWAGAGVVLEYVPGHWPRAGQGCVIELTSGGRLVRLHRATDPTTITVQGGAGGLNATERLDRSMIAQIGAVIARVER
jgi:transcriptional regulator with XRE-family HTH domain